MSLRLELSQYKAIRYANIEVDGITVLAGINGSGKSTLSQMFHYYITGFGQYEQMRKEDCLRQTDKLVDVMLSNIPSEYKSKESQASLHNFRYGELLASQDIESFTLALDRYHDLAIKYFYTIAAAYQKDASRPKMLLLFRYYLQELNMEVRDVESLTLDKITDFWRKRLDKNRDFLRSSVSNTSSSLLHKDIQRRYDGFKIAPLMKMMEDEIQVYPHDGGFIRPLLTRTSIYIDTPMALSAEAQKLNTGIWYDLKQLMITPLRVMTDAEKLLSAQIRLIIHGGVVNHIDDLTGAVSLRYQTTSKDLDIPLSETATGIKTFAYLLRLLEYGHLDRGTLLIIDEPEAHLHPEWVVKFAYIIVQLRVQLGIKVLLASHNSEMVEALYSMCPKYHLEDTTHFYLAAPNADKVHYDYQDLGCNNDMIFRSFNKAFDQIEYYGG